MDRDAAWAEVWNIRDEDKADWNGCEACFDSPAEYEAWVGHSADLVAEELALGPSDAVLDLGCGSGRQAVLIAPRVESLKAVDFSRPALAIAQRDRQEPNIEYEWADLNAFDPAQFAGRNKAYAIGSMLYLQSVDHVLNLVDALIGQGTDVMLCDLPDAELQDTRPRDYDRELYSHLHFREDDFLARFPGARIVRGRLPEYVIDAVRFSVVIPANR